MAVDYNDMKWIEQAELDTLVREMRAKRDRDLKERIARGAKAVARFFRAVGESIREAYEAERIRSSSQADSAMHRWSNRYSD